MSRSDGGIHVLVAPSWYPLSDGDFAGSFFREQAHALSKRGLKIGVIAPISISLRKPFDWSSHRFGADSFDDDGVPTVRHAQIAWTAGAPYFSAHRWVARGLKLFARYTQEHGFPDVVHAHSLIYGGVLAAAINKGFGIPYVVTEHRSIFLRDSVRKWQKRFLSPAVSHASALIAVSQPLAQSLVTLFPGSKWSYIPNMVDDIFLSTPLKNAGEGDGTFTFCTVCRLTKLKGVDVLVRAFAKTFRGSEKVRLIVCGDGEQGPELRSLVSELGLERQVSFTGQLRRPDVVNLLQSCDVFVLPSRVETFGVAIVEAMALGLPVVATKCGGPEVTVTPADGVLVEIDDPKGLALAMRDVYDHILNYDARGIRERAAQRFSSKTVHCELSEIYSRILDPS